MRKLHYFQTDKQKSILDSFVASSKNTCTVFASPLSELYPKDAILYSVAGIMNIFRHAGKYSTGYSLSLVLINIISVSIFSTASYAQEVTRDPAQTLARCRNYLNSDQSLEKIAEDDQKVLEIASCVEYGMDPPLRTRPEGGKTANKAARSGQLSNMQCPPLGSCLFGARTNRADEQYYCCPEHTGGTVTSDMATGYYICQDEKGRNKQRVVNPLPGALVGEYFFEVSEDSVAIGKTGCNYKEDSYVPPKECCTIVPDDNSGRYYRCISWDTQAVQTFLEPPLTAVVNPAGQQCAW